MLEGAEVGRHSPPRPQQEPINLKNEMESRRKLFFKGYTHNNEDKPSTSQGFVGRKRSLESEFQVPKALKITTRNNTSNEEPVTKLRRANTIDYVSVGMTQSISPPHQPDANLHEPPCSSKDSTLHELLPVQHLELPYHQQEGTLDNPEIPQVSDTENLSSEKANTIDYVSVGMTQSISPPHQLDANLHEPPCSSKDSTLRELLSVQHLELPYHQQEGTLDNPEIPQVSDTENLSSEKANTIDYVSVGMTQSISPPHQLDANLHEPPCSSKDSTLHELLPVQHLELPYHQQKGTLDNPEIPQVSDTENLSSASLERMTEREQEIELCLQEIRTEDQVIEQTIVIEIEEIGTSENQERNNKYKYIDFLSEDETFSFSSSREKESNAGDSNRSKRKKKQRNKKGNQIENTTEEENNMAENEIISKKKKKRINKSKERSLSMRAGKEYVTKSGKIVEARAMKSNPCTPDNCVNKCYEIPEIRRKNIFDHYWSLSKERRKDWLVNNSKKEKVKRKRIKDIDSRRQFTYSYFINDGEGKKAICLKFLLNTIGIKQKFLHNSITNSSMGTSDEDKRGKKAPGNKTSETLVQSVKNYIENLPAVPSHYCRKNSKKFYLPQEFRNLTNLYKIYKETQRSAGTGFVGERVFKNIFIKDYNIAFHIPRKDKCLKCIKYQNDTTNTLQKEKEMHLKDKEETYKRFAVHQNLRKHDDSILCVTFDLQKVLNTPYGESMLLYYSRKLAVYNLTFYESVTRDGFCYTWSEDQGKRGANEVCTILAKYIEKVDNRGNIRRLLLYCDSCPGQNKNKIVLACISRCLNTCRNITSIQINYLLPGHTFMPVDSMHSVIEKSTTNTIIWAPSQWSTVFELARKNPRPYYVEVLQYKDFAAWDALGGYFRGNMVGKISKVRVATFRKSSPNIQVKYSMDTEAEVEEINIVPKKNDTVPKQLYKSPLPISKKKYTDLVKLCTNKTIPERFHHEYIQLQSVNNMQDVLEDSDIEDGDND